MYSSVQSIDAARGELLDRYGRPLAVSEVSYDVIINEAYLPSKMKNTVIERIIALMEQEGQTWIDPAHQHRRAVCFFDRDGCPKTAD